MYPNHTRESPPRLTLEVKIHTNLPKGVNQVGRWKADQEKRKPIWSKGIKTSYNTFHSPLLSRPYPNQLLIGGYLPIFISHDPRKFSLNKIRSTVTTFQLYTL